MMIYFCICLVLFSFFCEGRVVSVNPSSFTSGSVKFSNASAWLPSPPQAGDDVVIDFSSATLVASSGLACQNFVPPLLLIDVNTPQLASFTVTSANIAAEISPNVRSAIVVGDGATLNAAQVSFVQFSTLVLQGPTARVVTSSSFNMSALTRIAGVGTVVSPMTILNGLVLPGSVGLGCTYGPVCFPGSTGAFVYGDLIFSGVPGTSASSNMVVMRNTSMYLKYSASQPSSRIYTGLPVDRVDIAGATLDLWSCAVTIDYGTSAAPLSNTSYASPLTWSAITLHPGEPGFVLQAADPAVTANLTPFPYSCRCASCKQSPFTGTETCVRPGSRNSLSVLLGASSCQQAAVATCDPPCGPHGTCATQLLFCQCSAPWTGIQCDTTSCSDGCSGNGQCDSLSGSGVCACNRVFDSSSGNYTTFYGAQCSLRTSSGVCPPDCAGTCISPSGECRCNNRSQRGPSCTIAVCPGYNSTLQRPNCGGFGTCVQGGTCSCNAGYVNDDIGSCVARSDVTTTSPTSSSGLETYQLALAIALPLVVVLGIGVAVMIYVIRKRDLTKRSLRFQREMSTRHAASIASDN